ncbi:hypothetical protein HBI56_235020 [Parastagonospora nodorum]|uniref:Uncharacterized protein n=1 Tax=Phaeosphaeria nodorum (strain SN15 / ATCC MYA-4574 / FGSC 10173) TaxID=321614 RepID=A0A7U2EZC6_PHANO|nr:hypothetical protein HBH56_227690 [Parastagonospora nodorum]QRC95762.1 hypothetical protein JI435_407920 [Parastagonospora nodorum SN15]KAH3921744.1 hypothetical protein HBH54_235090 [Parastagonospora nodorum]KAH3938925.1 hypothetical protein HBH53_243590 [Parastagonospora nodorum]KAH3958995.1 hypothetical protein HBH51_203500 [Parastagonospora nodorum]
MSHEHNVRWTSGEGRRRCHGNRLVLLPISRLNQISSITKNPKASNVKVKTMSIMLSTPSVQQRI